MVSEHMVSFSSANWADEVERSSVPVLVDVGANWCPPCRMLAPIVAQLAGEYQGVMKVGTLDADAEPDIAAQYGVLGLPTLLFFKGGRLVDRIAGFTPKPELKKRIDAIVG
ncbi:MAG TPA: thioredoxin domain-containing protein [Symbiobacteriaceae bacterium]|nr:thioredoxin domain-containing protein [Symbiobacteriaceae bacterium]